jgi:hypothetical protein
MIYHTWYLGAAADLLQPLPLRPVADAWRLDLTAQTQPQIVEAAQRALADLPPDAPPQLWMELRALAHLAALPLPPAALDLRCAACGPARPHACVSLYRDGALYACDACHAERRVPRVLWEGVGAPTPRGPSMPRGAAAEPRPQPAAPRARKGAPTPAAPAEPTALLIGCGKEKAQAARPAQALYTGGLTVARIRHAQASGRPWAILSARHGLLRPEQQAVPYDLALGDLTREARAAWAQEVAAQVLAWLGELGAGAGATVELHAGADYTHDLAPALRALGVASTTPARGQIGQLKAWYAAAARSRAKAPPAPAQADLFAAQPRPAQPRPAQAAAQWSHLGLAAAAQEWRRYPSGATACAVGWGWSLGEGARAVLRAELSAAEVAALEGDGEVAPGCALLRLHRVMP